MKTNKIFKAFGLALVALAALATTSCKDEPDAYEIADGRPTISFIRPVSASSRDSTLLFAEVIKYGNLKVFGSAQNVICNLRQRKNVLGMLQVWDGIKFQQM